MTDHTRIIIGITHSGKKFRPSDWCRRLAGTCALFDDKKKIKYHKYITPCFIEDEQVSGVCVDDRLKDDEPDVYSYLFNFAEENDLIIIEGRRSELRENIHIY